MDKQSRVFTVSEQLRNIYYGAKGFVFLRTNRKHRRITKAFKERIMLAITQVNGCQMCSFVHTKLALDSGMSREQIQAILAGDMSEVPTDEAVAVLFGQHFADSKENPSNEALDRLIKEYGYNRTECILAACNMITMTNGMGINMDHFYQRLRFKRNKQSYLVTEVLSPLLTMLLFPPLVLFFRLKVLFSKVKILPPGYNLTT